MLRRVHEDKGVTNLFRVRENRVDRDLGGWRDGRKDKKYVDLEEKEGHAADKYLKLKE